MHKSQNSPIENIVDDDSLYKRPEVTLFNKDQWSYIKRRYKISMRELEISMLVCRGYSNKEIANDLQIVLGTVKSHIRNVYRKVRVKSKIAMLLRFMDDIDKLFGQSR
jgi:ATP/maltotriose-dependent transcriptional regulator MalT